MKVRDLIEVLAQWNPEEDISVACFEDWDGGESFRIQGYNGNRCEHELEWTEVYYEN